MLLFRKIGLAIVFLGCNSLVHSQTPQNVSEPISAALRAGDFDEAIRLSQAALKEAPKNAQLWTLQGIAFASKGDSKDALTAFQQALQISPNNIAALAGAAQIEYQSGSSRAVPLLNHLLQLRASDPTAHAMLAVLDYRKGN
jgi:cytochrome c-type biogenesis protein CcmH/NrfG